MVSSSQVAGRRETYASGSPPPVTPGFRWALLRTEPHDEELPATTYADPSCAPPSSDLRLASSTSATVVWVLLPAEAKARGFKSALAFRRWCCRHGVPVRCDVGGRMQWVDRRDVDRAVEGLPARHAGGVHAEASRSVADFIAGRRR